MSEMSAFDQLSRRLSTLPGLGPRSARRVALHLLSHRESLLRPLIAALETAADTITPCPVCGNLDDLSPCRVCRDPKRDAGLVCVVAGVADLWAIERTRSFPGVYHVLGGVLSALDGTGPERLTLDALHERARSGTIREMILALSPTVDGQTTAHYIADMMEDVPQISLTRLAYGVPLGGELEYLDDGTIATALNSRGKLQGGG